VSLFGLVLGFFYFGHKIKIDNKNIKNEKINNHINNIFRQYEKIDDNLLLLFNKKYDTTGDLKTIRHKIIFFFDEINDIISYMEKNLNLTFDYCERLTISKLYAFIEKGPLIQESFENLKTIEDDFDALIIKYMKLHTKVYKILYNNLS